MNKTNYFLSDNHLLQEGLAHHRAGRLEKAKKVYHRLLKQQPANPDVNHLLGLIEHATGNNKTAERLIRHAIALNPNNISYLGNLGQMLIDLGKYKEAIPEFKKCLALDRDNPDALNGLGTALLNNGDTEQAITVFQQALEIAPLYINARFNLGNAYQTLGQFAKAENAFSMVVQQTPDDIEAHILLAKAQRMDGDPDGSIATLKRALKTHPAALEAINLLGEIYEQKSQLELSKEYIARSLSIDKQQPYANRLLAVIMRRNGDIKGAISHLSAIKAPSGNTVEAQKYHFELGRLYDRSGQYEKAFEHFSKGNRLQANAPETKQFDKNRYLSYIQKISNNISPQWFDSWATPTPISDADTPIFLVSFPRSGTTLLDQILDSHPALQVMEEESIISEIIKDITTLPSGYPDAMTTFSQADIDKYRTSYHRKAGEYLQRASGTTLVDKLPLNIAEIRIIYRLFPNAKIIFAMRHPYDVCLSNFMQHFSLNDAMANFLTLKDTTRLYDVVMKLWRRYTELLPLNIHMVKYEDLVDNFEREVRKLLKFLELEWSDDVLDYSEHAKKRKLIDTPSYQAVTEPIYTRAKYRWKNYESFLHPYLEHIRPHAIHFGYEEY